MFGALHMTLKSPEAVSIALCGNFSGTSVEKNEVLLCKGKSLEIISFEKKQSGNVFSSLDEHPIFGTVRSVSSVNMKIGKGYQTCFAIGSDSGYISLLRYSLQEKRIIPISNSITLGKPGMLRDVPGQYVQLCTFGKILFVSSLESPRLFYHIKTGGNPYKINEEPLFDEVNDRVLMDVITLPDKSMSRFCCLEIEYPNSEDESSSSVGKRFVVTYNADWKNKELLKSQVQVSNTAHRIIALPIIYGGLIVCEVNQLTYYKKIGKKTIEIKKPLPVRDPPDFDSNILIVSYEQKFDIVRKRHFLILQNQFGDLYEVKLEFSSSGKGKGEVTDFSVDYYDTIVVSNSLCLTSLGMLFVASEYGDHSVYRVLNQEENQHLTSKQKTIKLGTRDIKLFTRNLKNLSKLTSITQRSLAPIMDFDFDEVYGDGNEILVCICGRGEMSSLRVIKSGLDFEVLARQDIHEMHTELTKVYQIPSLTKRETEYIVLCMLNKSLVLTLNGEEIVDASNSGLSTSETTLHLGRVGPRIIQILDYVITGIEGGVVKQNVPLKKSSTNKKVKFADMCDDLIVVGGESSLSLYKVDGISGEIDTDEIDKLDFNTEISCVSISTVTRMGLSYLAVGTFDKTVQIYSIDSNTLNKKLVSKQSFGEIVSDLLFVEMVQGEEEKYLLYSGLSSGVLVILEINKTTGQIKSSNISKLVGNSGVYLSCLSLPAQGYNDKNCVVASCKNKSVLCYNLKGKFKIDPLNCPSILQSISYRSTNNAGIIGICGDKQTFIVMKVTSLEQRSDDKFIPLKLTPKKIDFDPLVPTYLTVLSTGYLVDGSKKLVHSPPTKSKKMIKTSTLTTYSLGLLTSKNKNDINNTLNITNTNNNSSSINGHLINPKIVMKENKMDHFTACCMESLTIWSKINKAVPMTFEELRQPLTSDQVKKFKILLIGGKQERLFSKKSEHTGNIQNIQKMKIKERGSLKIFQYDVTKNFYFFVRAFELPVIVRCLSLYFDKNDDPIDPGTTDKVFVAVGKILKLYMFSANSSFTCLSESKELDGEILMLDSKNDSIFVADDKHKIYFMRKKLNLLKVIDQTEVGVPIWATRLTAIDNFTAAVSDKFGNLLFFKRNKTVASFYLNDIITRFRTNSKKKVTYSTINGAIGCVLMFFDENEKKIWKNLQQEVINNFNSILGVKNLNNYLSYYYPKKGIVDADICKLFLYLSEKKQREIAKKLNLKHRNKVVNLIRQKFQFVVI